MLERGIIRQASPGCFHLLPLGVRSLEKLTDLVDTEMRKIGGQKVVLPTLTNSKLWEVSGRLETVSSELFKVRDRHNHGYILSPVGKYFWKSWPYCCVDNCRHVKRLLVVWWHLWPQFRINSCL